MAAKAVLNQDQKHAFDTIKKFLDSAADTLVIKGYAGTGKTFLMQYLAHWLNEKKEMFCLLASTGRAASVLRGKTGFETKTVHGELYQFHRVDGDDEDIPEDAPVDKYGQMTLQFLLRGSDEIKRVYIVDESSMLSSEKSDDSIAAFGSGLLLTDFFDAVGSNKVIFVGDPGQLPPVGQNFSPALDMDWLAEQKRTAITVTLETNERTLADNDLLVVANRVRHMIFQNSWPKWPKLPASNRENIRLLSSAGDLFKTYMNRYKEVGTHGTLAIARANKSVQKINREFRKELYGDVNTPLQVNDVLLVNRNNYKYPLTNGDFVTVTGIGEIRAYANLHFQSIRIRTHLSDEDFELLLSLDILHGETGKFSLEQARSLMIEFSRRMKKRGVKPNTQAYKDAMKIDDYLNCLQATYGYAVTCHKAQGGEWNEVFLFLDSKMYGMPKPELFRWWYTAITRAKSELNLQNEWWIE